MARREETRLVYSTDRPPSPAERGEKPAAASVPRGGVRIRLERRPSNRLVTVATGLPGSPPEVAELARSLKRACGTGGTLKDGALELQGDHRDKVEAVLAARGIRSKRHGG